jgi:hypothetical protein
MDWIGLGTDGLLVCCGAIFLLYAYRLLGKPVGADDKYDAAMARQSSTQRVWGWVIVAVALIGFLDRLVRGLM